MTSKAKNKLGATTTYSDEQIREHLLTSMREYLSPAAVAEIEALDRRKLNRLQMAAHDLEHLARKEPTQEQLHEAFTLVQNHEHWKLPVNKVLGPTAPEQRKLIGKAVVHFTGSVARFTDLPDGGVRVQAAGYYAAIGA